MKIKYSSIVGILAVLVLVASFVVPAKLATPEPVEAAPGMMSWGIVDTPDADLLGIKALYTPITGGTEGGSEVVKLLVGSNGATMLAIVAQAAVWAGGANKVGFLMSRDGGQGWVNNQWLNLRTEFQKTFAGQHPIVWDMAMAPDDPNFFIAAISQHGTPATQYVYVTTDGGSNWQSTGWALSGTAPATAAISALDISMDYGGSRDILVAVRAGAAATVSNVWTMKVPGFGGWKLQTFPAAADIIAARYSPTYNGDSTIAVVYSDATCTYLLTGAVDLATNTVGWAALPGTPLMRSGDTAGSNTPTWSTIIEADLELPSDFSGQSASLRRFYVSTNAGSVGIIDGVFRIDDGTVYVLMDTTTTVNKEAHSIAYWGTYASGKLLVGEVWGYPCTAAVPVWFTDSPTTCPVPCWYPAKKPPSGAAGVACTQNQSGRGNAYVVWSPTFAAQGVAYAVTGSSTFGTFLAISGTTASTSWPNGIFTIVDLDESAFSVTRNNGETWNQWSLIDTRIVKLTDVAPSADCTTVYLASVNNASYCEGHDSVWRTSINDAVMAPFSNKFLGALWERVRVSPTAVNCTLDQSNYAILRLAPDKTDGQVVGWAAGGGFGGSYPSFTAGANTQAMAWSPDFGDYWANIFPRLAVQDFAFETSTILYVLGGGSVQKMPYTGTAWSSATLSVTVMASAGHTIEALAPDKVIVGHAAAATSVMAISTDGGGRFQKMERGIIGNGNKHAIFDSDYLKNTTVYAANDPVNGLVYRHAKAPAGSFDEFTDMMTPSRFINYTGPHYSYFGIVQTNSKNVTGQGTLYAAHKGALDGVPPNNAAWSGVERTLTPQAGIPKPAMDWACLDASATLYRLSTYDNPQFTLEPKSLKLCGCLDETTYTTLWAIDNEVYSDSHNYDAGRVAAARTIGLLWAYTDCVAKKGPKLTMDDGAIIGCDPATGRNQEVNFTWEQLCIANTYELRLSKDKAMTQQIWGVSYYIVPTDVTSPALVYLAGGEGTAPVVVFTGTTTVVPTPSLECGHTYYWKVRVVNEVTQDWVNSPWSDVRGFTIKAGFKVTTPYYGPQLLAPDNGCGCACNAPICFSWSPFKETLEYKFELSENADMSSPLISTTVKTTAYQYTGTVKCNKNYFWRVMAVQPAPSEWSAVFSFMTQPEPPAPAAPPAEPATPLWVWVIIAIGAILVIVTLVLIFKTRRV